MVNSNWHWFGSVVNSTIQKNGIDIIKLTVQMNRRIVADFFLSNINLT